MPGGRGEAPNLQGGHAWLSGSHRSSKADIDSLLEFLRHTSVLLEGILDSSQTGEPPTLRKALRAVRAVTYLSDTYKTDQGHSGEEGRLHQVATRFTCHGGAPVRWCLGPVSPWQGALCRLEDTVWAFRVPEELCSIQALERRAGMLRSDMLSGLADLRRQLVASRLWEAAGEFDAGALARELLAAGGRMEGWLEESEDLTAGQLESRGYALRDRRERLEAAEGLLRFGGGLKAPEVRPVGEAGLVSLQELQPLLESAARTIGLPPEDGQGLIEKARRFPVEETPGRERFGDPLDNPLSLVDRLDAVEALYELVPAVRARSLVRDVRALLGYSLRDAGMVRRLLEQVEGRPGFPREALVVALGLLREPLEGEDLVLLGGGPEIDAAFILAKVLGRPGGEVAPLEVLGDMTSGAKRVLGTANRRVRSGLLLSAVG